MSKTYDLHEPKRRPRSPVNHLKRKHMILKCRTIHEQYHGVPLHMQLFKMMMMVKEEDNFLSLAEGIMSLRQNLSFDPPTKGLVEQFRKVVQALRKWLGPENSDMV